MMKLRIQIILAFIFASVATTAASAQQDGNKKLNEEDGQFWDRFLEGNGSLSVPTNPPTSPPTPAPSNSTTAPPNQSPTNPLTHFPSMAPPGVCVIELDAECVISGNSSQAGQPCDYISHYVEECLQRPTSALMLFNGGGCDQTYNHQGILSTCEDLNGGPPVNLGDEAYIVVTDVKGLGIMYFSGLVAVGDTYSINNNNEKFESDMFITIYTPDRRRVLQNVQFHTSCSRNLELKNRFGASQLVEFVNERQGVVDLFDTVTFTIEISIPITATSTEPIILQTLTASTNFAGDLDLSDQVVGRRIAPGSPVVTLEATIDASQEGRYMISFYVTGILESTGQLCTGKDTLSFYPVQGGIQPLPNLVVKGSNGSPPSAYPLKRCQGDCDNDDDCAKGLFCFQRNPGQPVPGCNGTPSETKDYCIQESDK